MTAELPPLGPTYAGDRETTGVLPSGAGRYDGGFCSRPVPDGQRGVAPLEDNCITCGDIAVEVRVVRLLPDGLADVDTGEGTERVSVALVGASVGDTILVHAGEAIAVVGR
jgi:hypothetical protein